MVYVGSVLVFRFSKADGAATAVTVRVIGFRVYYSLNSLKLGYKGVTKGFRV